MRYSFAIGTTLVGITNLESLATPVLPPKHMWSPFSEEVELADGSMRGFGSPMAVWLWGFLPRDQRDMLKTFCTGASSSVFIRTYTRNSADALKYYSCKMLWPSMSEETDATRRPDFKIIFKELVEVTP